MRVANLLVGVGPGAGLRSLVALGGRARARIEAAKVFTFYLEG